MLSPIDVRWCEKMPIVSGKVHGSQSHPLIALVKQYCNLTASIAVLKMTVPRIDRYAGTLRSTNLDVLAARFLAEKHGSDGIEETKPPIRTSHPLRRGFLRYSCSTRRDWTDTS
jgi:hypothetical protein